MIRALVFGGAFNPPTKAHIENAHHAMKVLGFDRVIFVPTKRQYVLEEQKKDFSFTDEERLHMLETIAKDRDWMVVEDLEIQSQTQPRTYSTLCALRKKGYTCSLLIGADKLIELQTGWLHVEEIVQEFGIVCMSRSHVDIEHLLHTDPYLSTLQKGITCIATPDCCQDISSSKVRGLLMRLKQNPDDEDSKKELYTMLPGELHGLEKEIR